MEAFQVESNQPDAKELLTNQLTHFLAEHDFDFPIICLCIGTDRSTGDALGPLVGTFLSETKPHHVEVYGTLDHPIHAHNLEKTMSEIRAKYSAPFIIAIDACLGKSKNIGLIQLGSGSIQPGKGVKKNLPEIGNIYIQGIVNAKGSMEVVILQNTRLSLVFKMAQVISASILDATSHLKISISR
jgi:putative sporulation protein YyaC